MRIRVVAIVTKDYRTHWGQSIVDRMFTRASSETTARVTAAKGWGKEGMYPVTWLKSEVIVGKGR